MAKPSTEKVYFAKQMQKMMMMLNSKSVQISTPDINGECIMTLLNKLMYLSDNSHVKCRYVHIAVELLKTEFV